MGYDLYQPLGQAISRREGARPRRRLARPGPAVALTLVLAASVLSVLQQPSLRGEDPAPPAAVPPLALAAPARPAPPPGPTIIRMNEDGGVTTASPAGPAGDDAGLQTGSIRVFEPGSLRQPEQLAHLPDEALLEESAFGALPVRAGDGRRPMDVYAGAASGAFGTRIAIVVGGLGISQTGTQNAIRTLPPAVTLGFAAAGNSLERWMQDARRNGHELLLQAPLEPFGYPATAPAGNTLTVADAAAGQFDSLSWALGRLTNYVGVMNFMGARFSADTAAMEPFLAEIGRRGLLYLDDGSSARSLARDVAMAGSIPFAGADRLLDGDRDPAAIRAELDTLERVARAQGSAIGVASAFETSVEVIADWIAEAEGRGIEIVPVSALAFDPEAR